MKTHSEIRNMLEFYGLKTDKLWKPPLRCIAVISEASNSKSFCETFHTDNCGYAVKKLLEMILREERVYGEISDSSLDCLIDDSELPIKLKGSQLRFVKQGSKAHDWRSPSDNITLQIFADDPETLDDREMTVNQNRKVAIEAITAQIKHKETLIQQETQKLEQLKTSLNALTV